MKKDTTPLAFGKYKGRTPIEVAEEDPSYIVWAWNNVFPKPCSKELAESCVQDCWDYESEKEMDHAFGYDGW